MGGQVVPLSRARREPEWGAGTLVLGRYAIESVLGRGGMGEVYRARDKRMARTVALKVMKLPRDVEQERRFLARFDREAEIVTRISDEHANVPFIFDRGVEQGRYVIVMELLVGRDLAEVVKHRGPFHVHDALYVAAEASKPLAIAHRQGVIHRDVKPANIFLCRGVLPAGKARVRLTDFGVARSSEASTLTDEHATVGTPLYIAPEAFREARSAGARVDVYAMGVVLWEMLAGQHPFLIDREEMPSPSQLFAIHAAIGIPSVLEARADVPPGVARAIACAVARDPDDRWPTIDAFLAELQRELGILLERAAATREPIETLFGEMAESHVPSIVEASRGREGATARAPRLVIRVAGDDDAALAYKRTEPALVAASAPAPGPEPPAQPAPARPAPTPAVATPAPRGARGTERMIAPVEEGATTRMAPPPSPEMAAGPSATPAPPSRDGEETAKIRKLMAVTSEPGSEAGRRAILEAGLDDDIPNVRMMAAELLEVYGDVHSIRRLTQRLPREREERVQRVLRKARAELLERFPDPIDRQWVDSARRDPPRGALNPRAGERGPQAAASSRRPSRRRASVLIGAGVLTGVAAFLVMLLVVTYLRGGRVPWAP